MPHRTNTKVIQWLALLFLAVVLFHWKILFTSQFSFLYGYEGANQAYAWNQFAASSIQQGRLPLWDPYAHCGRSFVGEMQTGLFYPLKFIVYLWPLDRSGLISLQLLHGFFVLAHVLAAFFMFFLAQELGLRSFPAFVAAVCFSLDGFLARVDWPDMLDSSIWLPLILLCLNRALGAGRTARGLMYACLSGLALGLAILGGRLHMAMMDVLVVVSFAAYQAYRTGQEAASSAVSRELCPGSAGVPPASSAGSKTCGPEARAPRRRSVWLWSAAVVAVVGLVAFAAGAVQLLPSMEYSQVSRRYLGGTLSYPSGQRIPYADLNDGFLPRSVFAFLFGFPFEGGTIGSGEVFTPYFGVLPFLLVVIGVWQNWRQPWVKYLTGLAVLSFFYSLGWFSFLHGLLYLLVPYLWMSRIAARFLYLTHFAMALLAGLGAATLLAEETPDRASLASLARVAKWILIPVALAIGLPSLYGEPEVNEWIYFSFLMMLGTYGLLHYVLRGHRTRAARFAAVGLILFDLYGFQWTFRSRIELQKEGQDHVQILLGCRNVANFLKSQSGLFRVRLEAGWEPNIGDLFALQTAGGMSATILADYDLFLHSVWRVDDLLNIRYLVKLKPLKEDKPVYTDGKWLVYENPDYCPRAWVVHEVVTEPSLEGLMLRVSLSEPLRTAVLSRPLGEVLEPAQCDLPDEARVERFEPHLIEITVRAQGRGLLVLSEVYYPGWEATVNGAPAQIHKVNGLLRGVVVPAGNSRVTFRYRPRSVFAGAILGLLALVGTFAVAVVARMRTPKAPPAVQASA